MKAYEIVRLLAESSPIWSDCCWQVPTCLFCDTEWAHEPRQHEEDCLWRQAREWVIRDDDPPERPFVSDPFESVREFKRRQDDD